MSAPITIYNSRNSFILIKNVGTVMSGLNLQQQKFFHSHKGFSYKLRSARIYNSRNSFILIKLGAHRGNEVIYNSRNSFILIKSLVEDTSRLIYNSRNSFILIKQFRILCFQCIYNSRNSFILIKSYFVIFHISYSLFYENLTIICSLCTCPR